MMHKNGFFSSLFGHQRKLFLLVFLWTIAVLIIFKSSLFAPSDHPRLLHANREQHELAQRNNLLQQQQQQQQLLRETSSPISSDTTSKVLDYNGVKSLEPALAGSQCDYKYPSLLDLQFNNIHWQRMTTSEASNASSYFLYNAYYDDRWRAGKPSVRILAMIDRIEPPKTNCLLWSSELRKQQQPVAGSLGASAAPATSQLVPLVTRASFVYAWYPRWGNYKDGLLQPWIVTCPVPESFGKLVPDSVSLVEVPAELPQLQNAELRLEPLALDAAMDSPAVAAAAAETRRRRDLSGLAEASVPMPPSFSSSSSASPDNANVSSGSEGFFASGGLSQVTQPMREQQYDCSRTLPITNNLPVFNRRPEKKQRFAVCVKGLDFPDEDVSVRLIEWIEMLNVLGASKIFLYNLNVHENVSRVLHYYQKRGLIELSELTLPGDQPNQPEYQHQYLKSRLTTKRQNELIPYNDCLYRNLNSFNYLALLDIDEIIMPLRHHNWHGLMDQVEQRSLGEQNYSRASYNARNVYFFDDLAGPLGTTSSSSPVGDTASSPQGGQSGSELSDSKQQLESGIPHYLHMMQHVYRSKNYTKPGQYVKCFHNTERVVSLHNHFPMNCFGQCTTYSIPVELAHLQHYRKDCVGPLKQACKSDFRVYTQRDTTIWKYKQQMIRRTTRVLNHLGYNTSEQKAH